MKKSKIAVLGIVGILTITAVSTATYLFNRSGGYQQKNLTFLKDQSAEDAIKWLDARYRDIETGEKITAEKLAAINKAVSKVVENKAINLVWTEEGPDNIGGRTRAIVIDRTNINRIWAGSVSGGLYVSTNRANGWSKVQSYPGSKFISSMTQTQNGTLFVATGSLNESWNGDGVYYSTDFGTTWTLVPGTANIPNITEIVCADNSNRVWMATTNGVRTFQVGDPGLTTVTTTSGQASAIQISKDGSVIVAAAGSQRTFVSTDGGNTFVDKGGSGAGLVPLGAGRIEYAISPNKNSSNRYSLYAVRTSSNLLSMHVSHDNGLTWSQFIGASGTPSNLDIYRNQGTYNSIVSVRPDDAESILIGGIDIWKWKQQTSNPVAGGFEKMSQWFLAPTNPKYVHADNHEMKWDNTNRLYVGNDGGIGVTVDYGITWNPANRGYNVTQFYGIAFDRAGAVMGGTQDNGTLYNDHTGTTYQEFKEVGGGDGFECEISFFNPRVMFQSIYYNAVSRSADRGQTFGAFNPPYPASYGAVGSASAAFPFHTELFFAENYDLNSQDSVLFIPSRDYAVGSTIRVPSRATGDSMTISAPIHLYFDDTVNYAANLTEVRTSVVNAINGQLVYLDNFNYTPYPSASGQNPPLVGDSLYVDFPAGTQTVVVQSVGTYQWYFAQNAQSGKIIELGFDSVEYNVAWDSLTVQDPFQSWFVVWTAANGGEIWGTRNAARFSAPQAQWVLLAKNIGGNLFSNIDIEFTKDLNTMFISTGARVSRISGLNVYTSDPNFATKVGYSPAPTYNIAPTDITVTTIFTGAVEGIALNPSNPNDLLILPGNGTLRRTNIAMTATGSGDFTSLQPLSSPAPFSYDAIIDREDDDLLVVGTSNGVFTSDNGGASWSYNSAGFEGTPVYEVRQNWRTFNEGTSRPGEIYIGTFGRGIFSSASVLGINENNSAATKTFKGKMMLYPNPTANNTSVQFQLNKKADVTIQVYSITGSLVKTMTLKNAAKGENNVQIDAVSLQRGTYLVKMVTDGQTQTAKFVKQ